MRVPEIRIFTTITGGSQIKLGRLKMKLLYCPKCGDMYNLSYEAKKCRCGASQGQYAPDGLNATYTGGIPFCFSNNSFNQALEKQVEIDSSHPEEFHGAHFEAWICPASSKTFVKKSLQDAIDYAIRQNELEGLITSDETRQLLKRVAAGELTFDQVRQIIDAKAKKLAKRSRGK